MSVQEQNNPTLTDSDTDENDSVTCSSALQNVNIKRKDDLTSAIDFDDEIIQGMTASYTEISFNTHSSEPDDSILEDNNISGCLQELEAASGNNESKNGSREHQESINLSKKSDDLLNERPSQLPLGDAAENFSIGSAAPRHKALCYLNQLNGTVTQEGNMVLFVAEDLETKIKLSSPVGKKEDELPLVGMNGWGNSTWVCRQSLADRFPAIDTCILNDLEGEVGKIATSVDSLTENLAEILHSVSALTVDCLETYRDVVCKTCDAVDLNIKVGGEGVLREWDGPCPKICTCHKSHFSQLPLISMMYSNSKNVDYIFKDEVVSAPSYKEQNEVLDEADEKLNDVFDNDPVMNIAVCIIKEETEIKEAMENLETIEVLTLLQSSDNKNITLRESYFDKMKGLKVLEIHGISYEKHHQNNIKFGNLYLKYDALNKLDSLEFVNLQSIQLLGSTRIGNKIPPVSAYDYMNNKLESNQIFPVFQPDYGQKLQRDSNLKLKLLNKNLIFLSPNDAEANIVPYEIYKEEQEKMGTYSFAGLKNLKFLRVYRCNFSEINWEVFDGLHNLETLSLEGNNLLFIPEFAFYGTPGLKSLSLAHNNLLNVQCMSLAGLLQLKHLDLSFNNISHLSELSLPPFPKLSSADFTNNPLEVIFPGTFEIMNATQQLYLGNPDTVLDIQPNSFSGLRSLLKLSIKNIDVDILEREIFRGMPQLFHLKISGKIRAISFDAFLDVPKLEKLVLKNCSIRKLSMDSFYGLYSLRILDLSNNLLSILPPGLFDQQFSLKELYLQNNNLTTLPVGFFANVPAKMIRLDGNPWHCTCAMKDWKPSVINLIKQKTKDNSMCQFHFDKGSMCSLTSASSEEFIYDKKVEPRCTTPKKFRGWGVFHLLHKELGCDKKLKLMKINRKAYLAQKLLDYERMMHNSKKHLYKNKKNYKKDIHQYSTFGKNLKNNSSNLTEQTYIYQKESLSTSEHLKVNLDTEKVNKDFIIQNVSKQVSIKMIGINGEKSDMVESILDINDKYKVTPVIRGSNDLTANLQNDHKIPYHPVKEQKFSKKEKEKLVLLRQKEERLKMKEKIKNSDKVDPSHLKKVMQSELENKRREKLKMLNMNS